MRTPAKRFNLGNEWRQIIGFAAGKNEVRPGTRQCPSKVLAQATTGSSDERYLAGEIEKSCTCAHADAALEFILGSRTTFIRFGSRA
jgi:hypothetical protein